MELARGALSARWGRVYLHRLMPKAYARVSTFVVAGAALAVALAPGCRSAAVSGRSGPSGQPCLGRVVSLAANDRIGCVVRASGGVSCWSTVPHQEELLECQRKRRCDFSARTPPPIVASVRGVDEAVGVSVGDATGCALSQDGSVACWEHVPDATVLRSTRIASVQGATSIAVDACGHGCAVDGEQKVWCWWPDVGAEAVSAEWADVGGGVVEVSAGGTDTCVRYDNGEVSCLHYEPTCEAHEPTLLWVQGLVDVVEVAVGKGQACARTKNGAVWCWEISPDVEDEARASTRPARRVFGVSDAVSVSAKGEWACALRAAGGLACWALAVDGRMTAEGAPAPRVDGPVTTDERATSDRVTGDRAFRMQGALDCLSGADIRCWGNCEVLPSPASMPGLECAPAAVARD